MVDENQKNQVLFMQLVFTFQSAAWQQLGKIKNPLTDKIERDLNQARFSIDILEMIRTKTQGNLSEGEKAFIDKVISELQLNYVAEFNREPKVEEEKKEEGEEAAEETKEEKTPEAPKKSKKKETKAASKPKTKKSSTKKKQE